MPRQQTGGRARDGAPPEPTATPRAAAEDATEATVPTALDETAMALAQSPGTMLSQARRAAAAAGPLLDPPGTPGAARIGANAAAFPTAKVLALFSSAHATNGWAHLAGTGWRRIATGSASAHVNLGMLLAAARAQGTATPVRHEGGNQIHEIYLW
jgi:hypothetical protein